MTKKCIDCGNELKSRSKKSKRCRKCWFAWRRSHPEVMPNYNPNGVIHAGYVLVKQWSHPNHDANGRVREHRLKMERKLRRLLLPNEVVHHINGIRTDNRISNLVLLSSNAEHLRVHRKVGCKVDGCKRGGYITRGYCKMHHHRWSRAGYPVSGPPPMMNDRSGHPIRSGQPRL